MTETSGKRILYLDNLRWMIVALVVVFHVADIFTLTGAKIHFNYPGLAPFDTIVYFAYPWFMCCLFVVAGISAKKSLEKRSTRQFAVERVKKLLVPFISYTLIFAPLTSAFSFSAMGGWKDFEAVPTLVLYFIMTLIGMGHLWFILELFAVSMLLLLVRRIDKKDKLTKLGQKLNQKSTLAVLLIMYIPLLGAAQVLNTVAVFRNLLYLALFLLGYYVFSSEKVMEALVRVRTPLLVSALALCAVQMYVCWGKDFSLIVNDPLVFLYGWIMTLAVIANAPGRLDFSNKFTAYMSRLSFAIYLFHYLPMIVTAYLLTKYIKLPVALYYPAVLVLSSAAAFVIIEVFSRLPVVRTLFGLEKVNKIRS